MTAMLHDAQSTFLGMEVLPSSILDEVLEEIKNQLLRKYMTSYGSTLNLAAGVDLYAAQVDGFKRIHTVTHTKPKRGESSRKKRAITFGHTFEELEVMQINRASVITESIDIAKTTDELADLKKSKSISYMDDLIEDAKTNHTQTDIVIYNTESGVQERLQLKNTKNTSDLLQERYAFYENSPDKILLPKGVAKIDKNGNPISFKMLHEEKLQNIIDESPDEQQRVLAKAILDKLDESEAVSRQDSLSPNTAIAKQIATDTGFRVSENIVKAIMPKIAALTIHGVAWEIKDAQANPYTMTTWERMQRFFLILWDKISIWLRFKKELSLEVLNLFLGFLKSTFKSFSNFISTIGKAINQVWEALYSYLTGKITSFSELVAVILKGITAVSIGTLAFTFEQFLTSVSIPPIIGGFIAAAFAGLAIVFANRGIDASIKSMLALLSAAELAKMRRQEIEALCAEALPRIIDEAEDLSHLTKQYYSERGKLLGKSFTEMKTGMADGDAQQVLVALKSINSTFGSSIPWKNISEFDNFMVDDNKTFSL